MQYTNRLINYLSKYDISINSNPFSTISPYFKHIFYTIPTARATTVCSIFIDSNTNNY